MTPAPLPVDVVIVSFNTRDETVACLTSLQEHPPAQLHDVFVVDNASTDGSADVIRAQWPKVRVTRLDRNVGFAAANNVALRTATAPLVLLLNSDTIVRPQALDRLVAALLESDAVAAGPRLVDAEGRPEVSFGPMLGPVAEAIQRFRVRAAASERSWQRRYVRHLVSHQREVDWVSGACLLVRRDAALAAGCFDERYFLYEEDVDFCAALRARGGRVIFTPAAEIVHLRGRSSAGRRSAHYDWSHLAFYEKHRPGWATVLRWWIAIRSRTHADRD
jgi:N-acetylglucosaminyl-diphospho-decaprenol L-rhamnosyltransferase